MSLDNSRLLPVDCISLSFRVFSRIHKVNLTPSEIRQYSDFIKDLLQTVDPEVKIVDNDSSCATVDWGCDARITRMRGGHHHKGAKILSLYERDLSKPKTAFQIQLGNNSTCRKVIIIWPIARLCPEVKERKNYLSSLRQRINSVFDEVKVRLLREVNNVGPSSGKTEGGRDMNGIEMTINALLQDEEIVDRFKHRLIEAQHKSSRTDGFISRNEINTLTYEAFGCSKALVDKVVARLIEARVIVMDNNFGGLNQGKKDEISEETDHQDGNETDNDKERNTTPQSIRNVINDRPLAATILSAISDLPILRTTKGLPYRSQDAIAALIEEVTGIKRQQISPFFRWSSHNGLTERVTDYKYKNKVVGQILTKKAADLIISYGGVIKDPSGFRGMEVPPNNEVPEEPQEVIEKSIERETPFTVAHAITFLNNLSIPETPIAFPQEASRRERLENLLKLAEKYDEFRQSLGFDSEKKLLDNIEELQAKLLDLVVFLTSSPYAKAATTIDNLQL